MSDRPTPETDAAEFYYDGKTGFVEIDFCRKLERERDEAREALMRIEDLFIDGTDVCADREKMGSIARAALEETK